MKRNFLIVLLMSFLMVSLPACNRSTCPAYDDSGMSEKKKSKSKKPKSGLWDKKGM